METSLRDENIQKIVKYETKKVILVMEQIRKQGVRLEVNKGNSWMVFIIKLNYN